MYKFIYILGQHRPLRTLYDASPYPVRLFAGCLPVVLRFKP